MSPSRMTVAVVLSGIVVAGGATLWSKARTKRRHDSVATQQEGPPPRNVTVVHEYVMVPGAAALPEPAPAREPASGEGEKASYDEAVASMKQRFEATPEDPAAQERNERALRRILDRTSPNAALPIESFACRGPSCRVAFAFTDVDHAQATLNVLPADEDWRASGMGFNALPDDPKDPACTRFTVYFTASPS